MSDRVFVGLGSNLGDRLSALRGAVEALQGIPEVSVVRVSSVYETEPVGLQQQPDFLNAVVEVLTLHRPLPFLRHLQRIEIEMGRRRTRRWGPRVIDLDLLFWGDQLVDLPDLTIPHPESARRNFVLVPMAEIAADYRCPRQGTTVAQLLENSPDPSAVRKVIAAETFWPTKPTEVGVAP